MAIFSAAVEAVKKGKWDGFVAEHPCMTANGGKLEENPPAREYFEQERKSTAMLDREENRLTSTTFFQKAATLKNLPQGKAPPTLTGKKELIPMTSIRFGKLLKTTGLPMKKNLGIRKKKSLPQRKPKRNSIPCSLLCRSTAFLVSQKKNASS
jgi:hypothetical protein